MNLSHILCTLIVVKLTFFFHSSISVKELNDMVMAIGLKDLGYRGS